jgi:hypothetical protein
MDSSKDFLMAQRLTFFIVHTVNKKFSTRYYLNLVLVDEEHRRYFKQQEITIYRRRGE